MQSDCLEGDIELISVRVARLEQEVVKMNVVLFGEYGTNGIVSRLQTLEERHGLIWKALGIVGTASILAFVAMVIKILKVFSN